MNLELFEEDLKEQYKNCPTSMIGFAHLEPNAQEAVRIVGKATFFRDKGTANENYNAVRSPTSENESGDARTMAGSTKIKPNI